MLKKKKLAPEPSASHSSNIKDHWSQSTITNIIMKKSEISQSYLTLRDPKDCSLPGSSVHGIFLTRVLEWVAISFSGGSTLPRERIKVSCIGKMILYLWAAREAPYIYYIYQYYMIKTEILTVPPKKNK